MNSIEKEFSPVLKSALEKGLVNFEGYNVESVFEPIAVFRKLRGSAVQEDDFKSQAELFGEGKLSKWPNNSDEKCIGNYSCSFFSNFLQLKKRFPSKRKYTFAKGNLIQTHGLICREKDSHIHCWVYQDAKIKDYFEVYNEER